jgi:hypothetical protein
MSSFDPELKKMAKEAIEEMMITAYCQTCGINFLKISAIDYLTLSSHFKDGTPDKWFVETGIHWVETEGHLILMDFRNDQTLVHQEIINQIWDNKLALDKSRNPMASKAFQKPHFYKYRELCKEKPI